MKPKHYYMVVAAFLLFQSCVNAKFVIPVIPDSQNAMVGRHELFYSQMRWIAEAKDSLRIPITLHVGDLVNFDTIPQFERASRGYQYLDDAGIPYAIALGNHDTEAVNHDNGSAAPGNVNMNLRKTFKFNQFFPVSRFKNAVELYEPMKSDNMVQFFRAGRKQFAVVTLEFCAREGAAQWMSRMMDKYPRHNFIVLTHYHLTSAGDIASSNAGYGDLTVADVYQRFIQPHRNALLVLSGHVCYSGKRIDQGINGNQIYQILSNYQCEDDGGGYIRLLEFDTKKKSIHAKMYSPFYRLTREDQSKFELKDVHFVN